MKIKGQKHYFNHHFFNKKIIVLFILIFQIFPLAFADRKVIKIGQSTSTGYYRKDSFGNVSGYGYDFDQLIANYSGWNIEYVEGSWSDLLSMLEDGTIDVLGFLTISDERRKKFDFTDMPAGTSTSCLVVRKDNINYAYEDFASFNGMTVYSQKGNSNNATFLGICKENNASVNLVECDSVKDVLQSVENGSADAGLVTNYIDLSQVSVIARIIPSDFYYAVKKGNKKILSLLNDSLRNIELFYPTYISTLYQKNYEKVFTRGATFTKEEMAYLQTKPVIEVIPGGRKEPFYSINNKTGKEWGILCDILNLVSKYTGIEFVFVTNHNRWLFADDMEKGNTITTITCDIDWVKSKNLICTQPFMQSSVSYLYNDFDNIKNVGFTTDDYAFAKLANLHPEWIKTRFSSAKECIEAVFSGKIDTAILNSEVANYYQKYSKYYSLKEIAIENIHENIGWGISEYANPHLCSVISKALLRISSDEIQHIIENNVARNQNSSFFDLIYTNPSQFFLGITVIIGLFLFCLVLIFYVKIIHKKNKEIQEANQSKSEFLARMSHDMRTPMNGILGIAELSSDIVDYKLLQSNMNQIKESGSYLLGLINDILDFQKINSGHIKLNYHVFDVNKAVRNVVDIIRSSADAKGIIFEIKTNIDATNSYIYSDKLRLQQVFINLLTNAIKYTPKGGKVVWDINVLSREKDVSHVCLTVLDTGVGISHDFLKNKLFKPFMQEKNDFTSMYAGSGLGLSIVKNLVELMNGKIQVNSEIDEGTEFKVYLDFKRIDKKIAEEEIKKTSIETDSFDNKLKGKRILLVEDHPLNAEIAKRMLLKKGCEVTWVDNGKKGVELLASMPVRTFDLVIMDMRMPVMDGITAAKKIRALAISEAKTIPIIAMTANTSDSDIKNCLDAGMNDFMRKPIMPKTMYETIIRYL